MMMNMGGISINKFEHKKIKVYVAGHKGMVGSSLVRLLKKEENCQLILKSKNDLDLTDSEAVYKFLKNELPNQIYIAAARVGGIYANNNYPAEFIYENIMIQSNIIHNAWKLGIKKILFLGSSCIYPSGISERINESDLMTGSLEKTNEPYSIAKISGIKLCESYNRQHQTDFRAAMPTNLYGYNDNYHPKNSHVIPGLISKFHDAKIKDKKTVSVWGSGNVLREFLHVDDLARACYILMNVQKEIFLKHIENESPHINIGYGSDITIKDLAFKLSDIIGFKGEINFDSNMPDGVKRKLLNIDKIQKFGWNPIISLDDGLKLTYQAFQDENKGYLDET